MQKFDEEFPYVEDNRYKGSNKRLKQFWSDYIKEILEGIVPEEIRPKVDNNYISNLDFSEGYMFCRKELQDKINQLLK